MTDQEPQREALNQRTTEGVSSGVASVGKRVPGRVGFPSIQGESVGGALGRVSSVDWQAFLGKGPINRGEGDSVGEIANPQVGADGDSSLPAENR